MRSLSGVEVNEVITVSSIVLCKRSLSGVLPVSSSVFDISIKNVSRTVLCELLPISLGH